MRLSDQLHSTGVPSCWTTAPVPNTKHSRGLVNDSSASSVKPKHLETVARGHMTCQKRSICPLLPLLDTCRHSTEFGGGGHALQTVLSDFGGKLRGVSHTQAHLKIPHIFTLHCYTLKSTFLRGSWKPKILPFWNFHMQHED